MSRLTYQSPSAVSPGRETSAAASHAELSCRPEDDHVVVSVGEVPEATQVLPDARREYDQPPILRMIDMALSCTIFEMLLNI